MRQAVRGFRFRGRILVMVLGLAVAACSSGPSDRMPSNDMNLCQIFRDNPHWLDAARDAEQRWGTPIAVKMAIIWRESSFRGEARPIRYVNGRPNGYLSSAYGFSQAIDGTWDWYMKDTGRRRADRTDFADAIDFVGWYLNKTAELNRIPFYDAQRQYFAYHEGHTGYERGSYRYKQFLLRAASQVEAQAARYRLQGSQCL